MKKLIYSILLVLLFAGLESCKKDEAAPALASSPEADAAEDSKSGGVYKGTFVGSTGTVKVTLQKGTLNVVVTLDGASRTLTTTELGTWTSGALIDNVTFTSGDWSAVFYFDSDGNNASITLNIPGHTGIGVALLKEKSDKLIKAFEGTYSSTCESGIFNLLIRGNEVLAVAKETGTDSPFLLEGTLSGSAISLSNGAAVGTIIGDNISGTFNNGTCEGTWQGKRTL